MNDRPRKLTLGEWDARYADLHKRGRLADKPSYDGPLRRHVEDGDRRLLKLRFDNSPAALNLWNFLLTEEDRLHAARSAGKKLVGTMKDLGTVPIMVYSLDNAVAFYPDGAWWIPCVMELSSNLLQVADELGVDESFCPVRAMLGAFATEAHFPIPDLLTCSAGAVCDDFSAIAQRLNGMGHPILWWEMPHRRTPEPGEPAVELPGGLTAPVEQMRFVASELERLRMAIGRLCGRELTDSALAHGIREANAIRQTLDELRCLSFTARVCPMPAIELLIAEMLAIHFCSDREESLRVLRELLIEVRRRADAGIGPLEADAARVFWVNPVADLQAMNLLEDCGGRVCGTEYLFSHALDCIPAEAPPIEALARTALADPMVGPTRDRVMRICRDIRRFGAEAVVVSRIPGASHCALEGEIIGKVVNNEMGLPVVEIEVPPLSDAMRPGLATRISALVETVKEKRRKGNDL